MDVFCRVEGQKLLIDTPPRIYAQGSDDFVRFLFTMSEDWTGLLTFAQFRQFDRASNEYLSPAVVTEDGVTKSYMAVTLPGWLKPGPATLVLCGTGNGTVIGTTNHVNMAVFANGLIDTDITTGVDETLYQQLVNQYKTANTYGSFALLAADTSLAAGMIAKTTSFYADTGIGGADYDIVALPSGQTAPSWWLHLHGALYAVIRGDKVYPEQIGANRNGTNTDTAYIQKAIDSGKTVGLSRGTYVVDGGRTAESDPALIIRDGVVISGDDMNDSILQFNCKYGIGINSGRYYRNETWPKTTISNVHFIGNDQTGNNGNTCIKAMRALGESGETSPDKWGVSFNLEHFQISNFECPFMILSAFQTVFRDGIVYECGSGVFTYYAESGGLFPGDRFSDQVLFDSVYFVHREPKVYNDYSDSQWRNDPFIKFVHVVSVSFINCSFQYAALACNAPGRSRSVRFIGCWFENVDYVYHLRNEDANLVYDFTDCYFVNVKGYKRYETESSVRSIDGNFVQRADIKIAENASNTSTPSKLIHGVNGGRVFNIWAPNQYDVLNPFFIPYEFCTGKANIRLPLNTITSEVYGSSTATMKISEDPVTDTDDVGCLYDLLVHMYHGDSRYYIAEYSIYKYKHTYYVSEPRVIAKTGVDDDTFAVSVAADQRSIVDPDDQSQRIPVAGHYGATLTFTATMDGGVNPTAIKLSCTYHVLGLRQSVISPT